jgi:hypothetical protein
MKYICEDKDIEKALTLKWDETHTVLELFLKQAQANWVKLIYKKPSAMNAWELRRHKADFIRRGTIIPL